MYFNTTDDTMRYWDGTDWIVFGSAGAGINNIDATTDGASLSTSNTLTGNGTLTLEWQGNGTTQYVDGAGGLKNLSSLPQGIVTSIGRPGAAVGAACHAPGGRAAEQSCGAGPHAPVSRRPCCKADGRTTGRASRVPAAADAISVATHGVLALNESCNALSHGAADKHMAHRRTTTQSVPQD